MPNLTNLEKKSIKGDLSVLCSYLSTGSRVRCQACSPQEQHLLKAVQQEVLDGRLETFLYHKGVQKLKQTS